MDDLLSSLTKLSSLSEPTGWEYASIIIAAVVALGLWAYLAFFKKGEKRKPGETIKNFFMMKGNFAEDLTKIVYFYMSIKTAIYSLQYISLDFWTFVKIFVGQLVWYRFVYEIIMAVIRKKSDK